MLPKHMLKIIAGNWKMHGSRESAAALASSIVTHGAGTAEVIIFPPSVFISDVSRIIAGSSIKLGGQDCHWEREGAFTGDISAPMLKALGCSHVILGHSERRIWHSERSGIVQAKARRAIEEGLVPVICVGESLEDREKGHAAEIVATEVRDSLPDNAQNSNFLLAYEPVWAIGTDRTASSADIVAMHRQIEAVVPGTKVLYGGSVKSGNAAEILGIPEVAGVLVGGSCLKAEEFCSIIDAAARL